MMSTGYPLSWAPRRCPGLVFSAWMQMGHQFLCVGRVSLKMSISQLIAERGVRRCDRLRLDRFLFLDIDLLVPEVLSPSRPPPSQIYHIHLFGWCHDTLGSCGCLTRCMPCPKRDCTCCPLPLLHPDAKPVRPVLLSRVASIPALAIDDVRDVFRCLGRSARSCSLASIWSRPIPLHICNLAVGYTHSNTTPA